ncbi:leucine--tRNA ligase [Halegenticoccus tardaugens]|uniref:leucine--tRNA ligase n=1 Tax=Halegenticoccus tardaugens TaxID=2071624 RepID=UPI00100BAC56|nr:leucine--tRNA ligase [Halegenticoccus tardaugens]
MDYDPQELERRWRERWDEEGRYEADPDPRAGDDAGETEPTFITVPYPYPSGGMHIGHARTYTVPDVYARYRRQRGDTVLFPMAWHVTGTPIIGAVERLKKGDAKQLESLKSAFNVPESDLKELETPMGYARYFIEEAECSYKKGMKSLGLSIDWRREFTTNDERYSKFITWQYETLKERGLLEKGLHPVKYCTNERQPVTTHDLLEGEEAEFQEYTLVRFTFERDGETIVAPMATLRPETVYGVTNAYVDPEAEYAVATVDGEPWFVSVDATEKLRLQAREVEILEEFTGERLVGERVRNPVTGDEVPVLPASFVDPDNATGVVMSVPAHSPDDYVALREAKADAARMERYGVDPADVEAIEPVPILEIDDYGEVPARDAVEEREIDSSDDPRLKEATKEVYNREFHAGRLLDAYGEYAGEVVEDVRDRFREDHRESGAFDSMYEFSEEVVCRCGGDVEVAEQDTWFLRYDDEAWKAKAHEVVSRMDAIPENTRGEYDHTVDWLNEWPCIRNYGLGTRLPWDPDFVIEPLSDSTIYMAYYTIAHRLRDVPVEGLTREFFDTLFYGPEAVDDPDETALELREEWDYWYPVDYRFSGNDLISNHLTFYLFHHAELFAEPEWPQGVVIMGMGLLEGRKMSSSKGHVVLPGEAIERYGADTVRFFLLNSAEPWQDYDWRTEQVGSVRDQLERFWNRAQELIVGDEGERNLEHVDRWLLSKLQSTVREVTQAMERSETRSASQAAFYGFEEHLRWYRRRANLDRPGARWTMRTVLETRLRLLAPFVPFIANELHERLTGTPAEDAPWPEPDPAFESVRVEVEERQVERLTDDVRDIVGVTDTDPEVIRVYVAADWKREVFDAVVDEGPDVGAVMGTVMGNPDLRERGDEVNRLVQDLVDVVRGRDEDALAAMASVDESAVYDEAAAFLEREFDADVELYVEGDDAYDPADRAKNAVPFRPAIHIE